VDDPVSNYYMPTELKGLIFEIRGKRTRKGRQLIRVKQDNAEGAMVVVQQDNAGPHIEVAYST
jgi:hypothetical protein